MGAGKATGLAAVGIAAGTLLGFYVLAPNVEGGPTGVDSTAEAELDEATQRADTAEASAGASDGMLDSIAPDVVGDALKGKKIALMTTADADEAAVDGVRDLVNAAGGEDAGTLSFDASFTAPDSGDELKSIAAASLPSGGSLSEDKLDPGYHAGELLGQAVGAGNGPGGGASESDRAVVFGALENAGFLGDSSEGVGDADAVVLVTGDAAEGDGDGNYSTRFVADMASALDATTGGAVLAGGQGSAEKNGAIGLLRDDREANEQVSSVDNVTDVAGRITTVRALAEQLAGEAGAYGAASNAAAATVGTGE
jgi:hypothetical protein